MVDGPAGGGRLNESDKGPILSTALQALSYQLCDRCLGRLFAKLGYSLSNEERGKAVRTVLALYLEADGSYRSLDEHRLERVPVHRKDRTVQCDEDVPSGETDDWIRSPTRTFRRPWKEGDPYSNDRCWLCNGMFDRLEKIRDVVLSVSDGLEFKTFQVGCRLDPGTIDRESRIWSESSPVGAESISEEMNREVGKRVHAVWKDKEFDRSSPEVAFIIDPMFMTATAQVKPLFIYGRYRKLKRGIPQTRWPCRVCRGKGCNRCNGSGRMYDTSVEELIGGPFKEASSSVDYKLHGMGREDIDVIMTGNGRPFILELTKPLKRSFDLDALGQLIARRSNEWVEVVSLRMAQRSEVPHVKEGSHLKRYAAIISFREPQTEETVKYNISLLAQSPIRQRTPERVFHRRADKVRERAVKEASVQFLPDGRASVELLTEGGLYIKELLHGDEGRTEPSLASLLGCQIEVERLDVTEVLYFSDNGNRTG